MSRAVYKMEGGTFYFTSELTADHRYFLCAWTEADSHLNFGKTMMSMSLIGSQAYSVR